jgi:hypothetical protein
LDKTKNILLKAKDGIRKTGNQLGKGVNSLLFNQSNQKSSKPIIVKVFLIKFVDQPKERSRYYGKDFWKNN